MHFKIKGQHLRSMRLRAKLTTVTMSQLAGVKTRKTYENWEKDIGIPDINQFFAMAEGCGYAIEPIELWFNDKPEDRCLSK